MACQWPLAHFPRTARSNSIGIGAPVEDIGKVWSHAIANPIAPREITDAPCQEVVIDSDLEGEGKGLDTPANPDLDTGFR